ncbi:O-antigen ligase family protein [Streptococcus saliviloxodontae]
MLRFSLIFIFYLFISIVYCAVFKQKKSSLLYLFPLIITFAINVSFSSEKFVIVGEHISYSVNSTVIFILILFLFSLSRNFRIDFLYTYFIIKIFYDILQWNLGQIYNQPKLFTLLVADITIFLLLIVFVNFPKLNLKNFLYSINYLALVDGCISILQLITKKSLLLSNWEGHILYTEGVKDSYRAIGIAGSNNAAGNLGAILFIVVLFNVIKNKDNFSKICLILALVATALSQTRIGIVAIVICLLFYYGRNILKDHIIRITKNQLYLYITGFVLGISAVLLSLNKILAILFFDRGNTASVRFVQFENVYNFAIKEHFFTGIGLGQWRSFIYSKISLPDVYIHSQYISTLAEQGIIIFILFVLFNFYLLINTLKFFKDETIYYDLTICLFLVNIICSNFNPNQLYFTNNIVYYMVMFGLYCYGKNKSKSTYILTIRGLQ